jgi:hypothetical protein
VITERTPKVDIVKDKVVLHNLELSELIAAGLTQAQIEAHLKVLLPLFEAEGLSPSSRVLADSILQYHRDGR